MNFFAETAVLVVVYSVGSMVVGFAYGTGRTKLSLFTILMTVLLSGILLFASAWAGYIWGKAVPRILVSTTYVCILMGLGAFQIYDSLRKKPANLKKASAIQTIAFVAIVSLDEIAIGFGMGVASQGGMDDIIRIMVLLVLIAVFLIVGKLLGNRFAKKTSLNLSWLAGAVLVLLALVEIFK